MRDFLFHLVIASIGIFAADFVLDKSIHLDDFGYIFIVSVLFTLAHYLINVPMKIKNGVALFVFNMFILGCLSFFLSGFEINNFWGLFIITLFISIVDALMTDEGE